MVKHARPQALRTTTRVAVIAALPIAAAIGITGIAQAAPPSPDTIMVFDQNVPRPDWVDPGLVQQWNGMIEGLRPTFAGSFQYQLGQPVPEPVRTQVGAIQGGVLGSIAGVVSTGLPAEISGMVVGGLVGAGIGAAAGATAGGFFLPGLGHIVGAVPGAIVGGTLGVPIGLVASVAVPLTVGAAGGALGALVAGTGAAGPDVLPPVGPTYVVDLVGSSITK